MKLLITTLFSILLLSSFAQSSITGQLKDSNGEAVAFANVALYKATDSSMVKVEISDVDGNFKLQGISAGNYFLKATFVGLPDFTLKNILLKKDESKNLKTLIFESQAEELEAFSVTEERAMVEVKPDRTVFNVQGTTNSVGSNAIELLRKAPAVTVDNNGGINVLGRSGVLVYIDGKQLPLSGDDLTNYLNNLTADQIDRIEIITNPGAKYDAEGNAGIIDIRLKKDKNLGANGAVSTTLTQGDLTRFNINGSGNYRNKKLNVFGSIGSGINDNYHNILRQSTQNGIYLDEVNNNQNNRDTYNAKIGTDFFVHKNHTLGFLVEGRKTNGEGIGFNQIDIADQNSPTVIDSVLIAKNTSIYIRKQNTYNLNYRFYNKKRQSLNIDLDYGKYQKENKEFQPNIYYNSGQDSILSEVTNSFNTPTDIDIYTAKADFESPFLKGQLSFGTKYSGVETANTFTVYNIENEVATLDSTQSNDFNYKEQVIAGYVNYSTPLGKKLNLSLGVRAEQTDASGNLIAVDPSLQEPPVNSNYLSFFPSGGITWSLSKKNSLALNYGRRINRPDYNVLNPFRKQLSELSIAKGNPFLKPEIVNNIELGYTLAYKYNFKLAYSRTDDKITRLIGPDDADPRASFVSWDNLATQEVYSFNASIPVKINKWWDAFFNASANYTDNQADYGDGAVVDVQNYGYSLYQQHTFKLPKAFKGEISSYYSGPGVWGGVFKYEANWSIDVGIQRQFFDKQLKVRLTANNIFDQPGWKGTSSFDGLESYGTGSWDNHYVSASLSYNFGNQNVKSRKRKSGLESEGKRVGKD